MCAYFYLLSTILLFSVFKCITVNSFEIDKSVTTLQQMYKKSLHSDLIENGFLNPVSMKDMSNALRVVTNNSIEINQMIPKLFNVHEFNPSYVFKLPQGTRNKLITMHRDRFTEPIFPNLTNSYIHLMRSKRKIIECLEANNKSKLHANDRNLIGFSNNVNKNENKDLSDDWSLLGLKGWQGSLSTNNEEKPLNSNDKSNSEKPLDLDLSGNVQENKELTTNLLDVMKNNKCMDIVENLIPRVKYPTTNSHGLHSDSDVYIARVNDPFGHSRKWNENNFSSIVTEDIRKKRGVIELFSMIKCSTGCDPIIFKGYGCYCGFLGDGYPVDGIDRCCKIHDKCYEYSNCIPYLEYFVPYVWKCYRGKPLCAINHGEWGGPQSCAARLCQCDLSLSICLRRYLCPRRRSVCRTSKSRILQNFLFNF